MMRYICLLAGLAMVGCSDGNNTNQENGSSTVETGQPEVRILTQQAFTVTSSGLERPPTLTAVPENLIPPRG